MRLLENLIKIYSRLDFSLILNSSTKSLAVILVNVLSNVVGVDTHTLMKYLYFSGKVTIIF